MASPEELYRQVKSGKVKLEQLNDKGKSALKGFMENKAAAEKYGTNEQRAGSAKARESALAQQAKIDQSSLNNIVYGGTNKLLSTPKKLETTKAVLPTNAITKIKDQRDNLQQMGLSSSRSAMASQVADKAQWNEEHGRNIPVVGKALRGLDKLKEVTKPFADVAMEVYTPAAGLSALNAATQGAEYGIARALPKLVNSRAGRIAQSALRETAVGIPATAGNTLTRTQDLEKATKDGLLYGGLGGAALGGAGRGLKELKGFADETAVKTMRNVMGNQSEAVFSAMKTPNNALPAPRMRGNVNGAVTPEVINASPPKDSPNIEELVRSRGHKEVVPETIAQTYNTKKWYHGTGTDKLTAENLDPMVGSHESLFGQGVYLTDEPTIAQGYAKSRGKRGTPTVYESDVKVDRVLDIEKPITPEVSEAILKAARGLEYHDEGRIASVISEQISKGATPEQVITTLREEVSGLSKELMIPTSEFVETFQDLATNLKLAGYDGITHTGGLRTGKDPHRVLILLDPQNNRGKEVGSRQVTRFDKYEPETVQSTPEPQPERAVPEVRANPTDDVEEILQSVQQPRVRDRIVSFLEEQEKAALARIAKRKGNLSSVPIDEWADHAIVMATQLGKGTIKAADFTEELVKQFGEAARPHAQAIYRKSKEILRTEERRASKEGQEAIAFNESGVGDATAFRNKVSRDAPNNGLISGLKKKGAVKKWWEKTRTQLVDDMAPLEGVEKRVTGKVASAEDSLYKAGRMFKGTPERAAQVVQDRLSPIVKNIEKSGFNTEDLGDYALAIHAKDVNAAGIKSGFTNADIDDVIRKFGTTEMEAARKQLIQINKDMMKELVDSGVVSKELASVLDDRWKNYVPLFRAFDDESVEFGTGLSNALANVANPIKVLKGSEKKVIDPLENMVKNVFQSINSAERNKVASKLHRLYEMDTQSTFISKLEKGEEVGRKNVVNVKVNGENIKYEVEPEVYKALLNLDKESSNMIINILSKPASLLRAGATLTPEFSLRNPMRDVVQAFVVSKSGFNPITDFGAGLIQTIKKGPLYKDWIDNLGAYGNVMSMDRNVHRQALEKVLKEPVSKKFVNIVTGRSLIRALRYITDTTESATKVGEYRAALRKGVSKEEAAYRSRDIMDFARAGSGVRQANKMVAFLNANIQGKSKLIRAIKENPTGTITRAFTAVTLPTVGIYALNKNFANDTQKETIDNAPDWMRNSFWLMAIPGTDVVARIPKPFDLAAIFSNLPERALDYTYENDKDAFDGFVSRSLKESALPMQISGLMPFIEGMANYSFFREGDIIPQREQGLEYSDQYDPIRTTETGKFLAKGAEVLTGGKGAFKNFSSPRVMDNTIQGLTAGLGKYGTDALDFILKRTGAVDRPVSPTKSIEQKPFAKAFLVDPNQGGKDMDKFYSTLDKLNKEKSSNKLNEEDFGRSGKTTNYLPLEKNNLLKKLDKVSDEVSGINKEIRSTEKSTLLTADQKRRKIDSLLKNRKEIVKESVELIK